MNLDDGAAEQLEQCIAEGGVAVFPSDTVYGVCCDPDNEQATRRLYKLKGRPSARACAVMFFSLEVALETLDDLHDAERTALHALLPGPVTVLLGNRAGAGGRYRIGHSVMRDALDIDGIYDSIRHAGIELPERPRSEDLKGRVVNCFMKCEADRRGVLRGRRQIMLDDSDVHHHRHSKAAVGGVAATAIGDPAVFVSVDAMHQGPHGGGPVIAIVELDE